MAYSDNFPATRPVFMADFANGGKIDPRATFSRASTANVWDGSKHLSSENLVAFSNDISTKTLDGVTATGGQTAPDGGTDAYKLTENSATSDHRFYEIITQPGTAITFSAYFKYIGRQWVNIRLTDGSGSDRYVWFDIQNGVAGTAHTGYSNVSISSSGNGYYKCSATLGTSGIGGTKYLVIAGASADGSTAFYAGLNADAFAVWGIQVSSTGETVLNETNGSIHRQYAPSLVSKSNNAARFDHTTDGQSVAKGILIEEAATNLLNYSEQFDNGYWTKSNTTVTANAAVAPSGELTADLITADQTGGSTSHNCSRPFAFTSGNTYTLSVFAKAAGYSKLWLYRGNPATWEGVATFELTGSGTVSNVTGSASIEPVGNGWYRCSVTGTAGATASTSLLFGLDNGDGTLVYDGDDYSGVLLWGAQMETGAASSYIKVEGSTVTRAAESLSVALTQAGFNGGPFTVVSETEGGKGSYPRAWVISDATNTNRLSVYRNSGAATTSTSWIAYATDGGTAQVSSSISNTAGKLAVSYDTNNVSVCASGGAVTTDTTAVIPSGLNTLKIGVQVNGVNNQLNGHCKRIALYNEALSDTNLQALTS